MGPPKEKKNYTSTSTIYYMFCFMCQVSDVRCQVSGVWCHMSTKKLDKVTKLVGGGWFMNKAYTVNFILQQQKKKLKHI